MKKIFLVDDEPLITLSIARMIERSGEDYEVVGMASNGREAMDFLKQNAVDIAIIDIRMPILDGIGLLEKVRQNKIPVRIIILSAYRDFRYAQEAIHYGASAYLLKPLSQEALMDTLADVSKMVDRDKTVKTATNLFSLQKRQQAVYQLLGTGEFTPKELPPSLQTEETGCLLMLTSSLEYPQPFVEDCLELGWNPYRSASQICFLPDSQASPERIFQLAEETKALAVDYFLPSLAIAQSNGGFQVADLKNAVVQCKVASMYSFYFPEDLVIAYSDIQLFGLSSIRPIVAAFEKLHSYIRLSSVDNIFQKLKEIYDTLKVEMSVNPQTLYQLVYEIFMELALLERKQSGTNIFANITLQHLQNFTTLDALYDYAYTLIRDYFDSKKTVETDRDEQIVNAVRRYCQENYALDCTLDDIAASIYISKSYLSQIFKAKCGVSLWNYFTDIRIEKAKELLASNEIKVNKVGEMVGYPNPSHFGHIFRSHVGVSPKEYREKIHERADH